MDELTDELTGVPLLTLRRLLDDLGAGVLEVVVAPDGMDVAITDTAIHDPTLAPVIQRGDLVLAVGLRDDEIVPLLAAANAAGAAGVVCNASVDVLTAAIEADAAGGVAVLAVPSALSWSHLHSLVRTAIASEGRAPQFPEPGGVPLGDLFALANAVASMVGGPTTIEDPQFRVLAYSSTEGEELDEPRRQTILGRRVPEQWIRRVHETGLYRRVYAGHEPVEERDLAGDGTLRPRLAVAIKAGGEILGSVWVAEGEQPFGPEAKEALAQAGRIAALHLLRHRSGEDLDRRRRGEQLRAVLQGDGPLRAHAVSLGLEMDVPSAVLAFETMTDDDAAIARTRQRVIDLVTLYCEAFRRQAVSVAIGSRIYTLLPLPDETRKAALERLAHDVVGRAATSLGASVAVGIGSVASRLADVPDSRADADRVLRILHDRPELGPVATASELWAQAVLMEWRDLGESTPRLRRGRVAELWDHDLEHDTFYIPTLRAYLAASGHVPTASAGMDVHPNTFRHRVRRLGEVSGLDLEDPDQRLASAMQLLFIPDPPVSRATDAPD